MKSNWIKYLFIIFIIIILILAVYKIKKDEQIKKQEEEYTSSNNQDSKTKEIKLGIANLDTMNPILSKNKNVQDITKLVYEPLVNLTSD